jgi:transposase
MRETAGTLCLESMQVDLSMDSILNPSAINGDSESSEPEVGAIRRRRLISLSEKRRILQAYARCKLPGERCALLRKEGVHCSVLPGWRKQLARTDAATLASPRSGPKASPVIAQRRRDEQLVRENLRLRRQLERANAIIEVQQELCALLGVPPEEQESKH